jgi:hypothetical protein
MIEKHALFRSIVVLAFVLRVLTQPLFLVASYITPEHAIITSSDIVKLNIGGRHFVTTKTTLLSRGDNFFKPLVMGEFSSLKDEQGAFFIDRNGDYFAPILDYLRCGNLIIPADLKLEAIFEEASFYSIDLAPGLCGDIKEGLYTSSNWILFLDRDPDHPWIFGITGSFCTAVNYRLVLLVISGAQ